MEDSRRVGELAGGAREEHSSRAAPETTFWPTHPNNKSPSSLFSFDASEGCRRTRGGQPAPPAAGATRRDINARRARCDRGKGITKRTNNMVVTHDVLVPLRFLALVGHFLAGVLAIYSVRDNVIVALPYNYDQGELDRLMWVSRFAMYTLFLCLLVNSISFFGGFTTFDTPVSIFNLTFHAVGGMLLALTVIHKGHYLYLWYIVGIFSGPPFLTDLVTLFSLLCIGRKRRW